jgi:hypothetical protein
MAARPGQKLVLCSELIAALASALDRLASLTSSRVPAYFRISPCMFPLQLEVP